MRDISICRKCNEFIEHDKSNLSIRCCLRNISKQESSSPISDIDKFSGDLAFGNSEYECLELYENCLYYTEQFISACCRNGKSRIQKKT